MQNTIENIGGLSVELFASFLDGNLSLDEMQEITMMIDESQAFSDIISDSLEADELMAYAVANPEVWEEDLSGLEFDIPIIADPVIDYDSTYEPCTQYEDCLHPFSHHADYGDSLNQESHELHDANIQGDESSGEGDDSIEIIDLD